MEIYCFELVTGTGDLTFNAKQNLLGAICLSNEIAYHLFSLDTNCSDTKNMVKLIRKSKWHPQYGSQYSKESGKNLSKFKL